MTEPSRKDREIKELKVFTRPKVWFGGLKQMTCRHSWRCFDFGDHTETICQNCGYTEVKPLKELL